MTTSIIRSFETRDNCADHQFLWLYSYWRMVPEDWEARLAMVAAMGFNTITIYAHWALSEPSPAEFDFTGAKNITAFVELAWQVRKMKLIEISHLIK